MVIDASAALAILLYEPEAEDFAHAIEADSTRLMPATAALEAAMVLERMFGLGGASALDTFLQEMRMAIVPFAESDLMQARLAFRTYGKGRHPAGLNFGDCMVYAAAKAAGEALLFKGTDFARTDIARHPVSAG